MRAIIFLILLAGCASPQPKTVTVTETKTVIVNKYIVIHDRPAPAHSILLSDYAQTLNAEKPIVIKSKAPVIDRLIQLDDDARSAFAPLLAPHHRATPAEMKRAIAALGALVAYVGAKK
jgi:hypothetical protein